MKKTRILSLLLAAAMFCALFSGCVGGKTVMKVGGNAISEDVYNAAVAYADMFFQQSYGFSMADMLDQELAEGQTGADMLKEQADGLVKEFESVVLFAKDKGISLSADEKAAIEENKKSQIDAAGGRKAFLDSLKADGVNEAFFDYMVERQQIYSKLYTELFTGEGEFAPGSWCTFCRAAVRCKARAQEKLDLLKYEFADPPLLTDEQIEDILDKLDGLTIWASEIFAYAQEAALHRGKRWRGFKVVEGRSVRRYTDEEAVIQAAREAGYTDIFRRKLLPITEMEKLMGRQTFREVLGALVEKPAGIPTLVPDSDKRPEITIAELDFEPIVSAANEQA